MNILSSKKEKYKKDSKDNSLNNISFYYNNNKELKIHVLFRDGLINLLLTKEFYSKTGYQLLETLFDKIFSIIDNNDPKDICLTNPNIFLRILNFTSLLEELFVTYDFQQCQKNFRGIKCSTKMGNSYISGNSVINNYFKLIKALLLRKKIENNNDFSFYRQLFRHTVGNFRENIYVGMNFLMFIYDLFVPPIYFY